MRDGGASEVRRARAVVHGRVQGVGYRASTADKARELGLDGWVANRLDGKVELEAEGPPAAVAALLAWCDDGPPSARVERVVVSDVPPTGGRGGFAIRR